MSANFYVIEDYENETAHRPKKTNPIKSKLFGPPKKNIRKKRDFYLTYIHRATMYSLLVLFLEIQNWLFQKI